MNTCSRNHENPTNDWECPECGELIEDWEPNDIQISAHYGQTKEPKAA